MPQGEFAALGQKKSALLGFGARALCGVALKKEKGRIMGTKKLHKTVPFWGKLCAAVLCASIAVSAAGDGAFLKPRASSLIEQLEEAVKQKKEENEKRQKQIDSFKGDISNNKSAMAVVSAQIDGINEEIIAYGELITAKIENISNKKAEIEAVEQTIIDKENEIEQKKEEIAELQAQNKENLERFAQMARIMYMNDSSDIIPVLNGSDDWYNYFVYSDVVRNISKQNMEFMQRLQNSINAQEELIDSLEKFIAKLEADKVVLQQQKAEYEQQMADLEAEKASLKAYADEKLAYLNSLAAKNSQLQSKVNGLQSEIKEGNEEIEELNRQLEAAIRAAQSGNQGQAYTDGFRWPVNAKYQLITTNFGYDGWRGGMHYGLDIGNAGIGGANIYAAQSGIVITVSNTCPHNKGKNYRDACGGGYGNYIIIDHGNKLSTLYAHCGQINVKTGQFVNKGDVIGLVGSTGWSTGFHLHFETRVDGIAVNPRNYTYQYFY